MKSRPDDKKTVWTTLFVVLVNLFYSLQRGSNVFITEKKQYFSKDSEGAQHFPEGPNLFQGGGMGAQMLISIETHITCDSPGGPYPYPLSGSAHPCSL